MPDDRGNGGVEGEITSLVDRLERLDEERRALAADFKDVLDAGSASTGLSKVAIRNILRERRKSRGEIHATYAEMGVIRRALKMRDPLLPIEEDDDEPGVTDGAGARFEDDTVALGEAAQAAMGQAD